MKASEVHDVWCHHYGLLCAAEWVTGASFTLVQQLKPIILLTRPLLNVKVQIAAASGANLKGASPVHSNFAEVRCLLILQKQDTWLYVGAVPPPPKMYLHPLYWKFLDLLLSIMREGGRVGFPIHQSSDVCEVRVEWVAGISATISILFSPHLQYNQM